MNKEFNVILELLKYDNINVDKILSSKNINWMKILGFLTYHRLAGLAYEKIAQIGVRSFEFPLYITTAMINNAQTKRTKEQNHWINLISEELVKENIPHAFLKGAILNNTFSKKAANCILVQA